MLDGHHNYAHCAAEEHLEGCAGMKTFGAAGVMVTCAARGMSGTMGDGSCRLRPLAWETETATGRRPVVVMCPPSEGLSKCAKGHEQACSCAGLCLRPAESCAPANRCLQLAVR